MRTSLLPPPGAQAFPTRSNLSNNCPIYGLHLGRFLGLHHIFLKNWAVYGVATEGDDLAFVAYFDPRSVRAVILRSMMDRDK